MKTLLFRSYIVPGYLSCTLILFSCYQTPARENPNINPEQLLKNYRLWWTYNYNNIRLSANYVALDTNSQEINKDMFLSSLASGDYVAFRLATKNKSLKYRLYHLNSGHDKNISSMIKQFGETGYQQYKLEGTEVPDFNFTDLNGNVYNKETTKGKIVVLKCWFIRCGNCVLEMPALNEFVKQYKDRNDVLFVSLAFDPQDSLRRFLTRTKFDYAVVSVPEKYMENKLKVVGYPTHFIVNRQGRIEKVIDDYRDMMTTLKSELAE